MSTHITRWLLFAALILLAPAPYFLVEFGRVPPARMLQLTGYLVALVAGEGGQGAVVPAVLLIGVQAVLYIVGMSALSALLARSLAGLPPRLALGIAAFLVSAAVVGACLTEPYVTPFSVSASHGSLMAVFR